MKKIKLVFALLFIISIASQAQISVNVNFGSPPVWAPAERVDVHYYYLPDIDAYYDVPSARFIYIKNGSWFRSGSLPYRYRNYNLRGGNVVFLTDYNGNSPYLYHKNHKNKYPKKIKFNKSEFEKGGGNHDNGHRKSHGNGGKSHGKGKGNGKGHK